MTLPVLSAAQLNRATLARQLLLGRSELPALDAIEQLAGLQAQEPASPYIALWARVRAFRGEELDQDFRDRRVVKATAMRVTLHALSAPDFAAFWPAIADTIGLFRQRSMSWPADAMPLDELVAHALDYATEPRTNVQMRDFSARLARAEGDREAWRGVRLSAPFVHVPGHEPWSFGPRPTVAAGASWLGTDFLPPEAGLDHLVRRYLRAFGPASIADVGRWTRIVRGRITQALDRLGPELRTFRDESGRLLHDVLDGLLPPDDTPAPPRLLPMWDSMLLAYDDRDRVMPERHRSDVVRTNGDYLPTVLVDGRVAGVWRAVAAGGRTSIVVEPFEELPPAARVALEEEAESLARFVEGREPEVYRRYTNRWGGR